MAAPSAQAADVVKSLMSFIDVLLSVPGRGAIRRHWSDRRCEPRFGLRAATARKLEVQDLDVTGLNSRGKSKQIEIFPLLPLGHFRVVARELGPFDGEIVVDECLAGLGQTAILGQSSKCLSSVLGGGACVS